MSDQKLTIKTQQRKITVNNLDIPVLLFSVFKVFGITHNNILIGQHFDITQHRRGLVTLLET